MVFFIRGNGAANFEIMDGEKMNFFTFYSFVISHLHSAGVDINVVIAWVQAHLQEVLNWLRTLPTYEDVLKQILAHIHA